MPDCEKPQALCGGALDIAFLAAMLALLYWEI
jgi:hypothetical protein